MEMWGSCNILQSGQHQRCGGVHILELRRQRRGLNGFNVRKIEVKNGLRTFFFLFFMRFLAPFAIFE